MADERCVVVCKGYGYRVIDGMVSTQWMSRPMSREKAEQLLYVLDHLPSRSCKEGHEIVTDKEIEKV